MLVSVHLIGADMHTDERIKNIQDAFEAEIKRALINGFSNIEGCTNELMNEYVFNSRFI